jgi:activator of HSP90 ATPase
MVVATAVSMPVELPVAVEVTATSEKRKQTDKVDSPVSPVSSLNESLPKKSQRKSNKKNKLNSKQNGATGATNTSNANANTNNNSNNTKAMLNKENMQVKTLLLSDFFLKSKQVEQTNKSSAQFKRANKSATFFSMLGNNANSRQRKFHNLQQPSFQTSNSQLF